MEKKDLAAFLLGLSAGVGISLLFAPKSGQEIRALIKDKADEGTEYLKQCGGEVKQTAAEWVDKGKEAPSRQKGSLGDAMEAGKRGDRDVANAAS
jgi:gas vesicle protein